MTNEVSEWTLLTYLAQREGFDVYVEGRTLFFNPPADASATTAIYGDAMATAIRFRTAMLPD